MAETPTDTKQILRDYTEMWNEQDASRIPDVVSESFVVYNPTLPDGEARGHDGLEEWMNTVWTGFPDFQVEITDLLASGETVMAEVNYAMTHEGEFNDIPPTEQRANFTAMAKFRTEDGKVKEHRDYVDRQEFFEQIGLADE